MIIGKMMIKATGVLKKISCDEKMYRKNRSVL